jgi:hypothetical protein
MNFIYIIGTIGTHSIKQQVESAVSLYVSTPTLHQEEDYIKTYFIMYGNPSQQSEIKEMLLEKFICPEFIIESKSPFTRDSFTHKMYTQPFIFIHRDVVSDIVSDVVSDDIPSNVTLF